MPTSPHLTQNTNSLFSPSKPRKKCKCELGDNLLSFEYTTVQTLAQIQVIWTLVTEPGYRLRGALRNHHTEVLLSKAMNQGLGTTAVKSSKRLQKIPWAEIGMGCLQDPAQHKLGGWAGAVPGSQADYRPHCHSFQVTVWLRDK